MSTANKTEVWLRGPLPVILPALQPVAHALLQAKEELEEMMTGFPEELLWQRPAGVAAAGFHLQHLTGVLDRLFTYAGGSLLNEKQLEQLAAEGKSAGTGETVACLLQGFSNQVNLSLMLLEKIPAGQLFETRGVGRAQVPSTVMGLLVHAAEHTMRHLGQLLVTVRIVKAGAGMY